MKKHLSMVVVLALAAALAAACGPKVNDPADVQAVKTLVEDFGKAMNAGDPAAMTAVMTDKTIYADNHFPVAVGAEAVKAMYTAITSQFPAEFQVPVDEVRVTGDTAVARGTWTITLTPKAPGMAPIKDRGHWMSTASRQADGSWKWDAVVPNSDQPLPGATADGADEQALMQVERDWAVASAANDAAALDKLTTDDYVNNNAGQVVTKKQMLANIRSGASKVASAETGELRAFVVGDTATVYGVWTEKSTLNGKDTSGTFRFVDTFVKRDGRWLAAATVSVKQQ
jgi:uncharacterized protein (TIGR02246 family)